MEETLAGHSTRRQEKAQKAATRKAEERLEKIEMGQSYQAAVTRMGGAVDECHPLGCLGTELWHQLHMGREAPPVTPGGELTPSGD